MDASACAAEEEEAATEDALRSAFQLYDFVYTDAREETEFSGPAAESSERRSRPEEQQAGTESSILMNYMPMVGIGRHGPRSALQMHVPRLPNFAF